MPHLVVEHTATLAERIDFPALLTELHQTLMGVATIDPEAVKSRAVPIAHSLTGTAGAAKPFVHLTVSLIAGRPEALLRETGEQLFQILNRHVAAGGVPCAPSLYLHEMPAARYWK